MTTDRRSINLLPAAAWFTILIPIACAVSRFAADMLLSFTALFFLVQMVYDRNYGWLKHRWVQVALLLWAYVLLRSVWTEDIAQSFKRSGTWLRFPVFAAACAFWVLRDQLTRHRLILSLSGALAFMLLDTALQYFTGTDILGFDSIPAEGSPRLTGPFSAPRIGIMLVWMAIPVIAYWLMNHDGTTRKGKPLLLGCFYAIATLTVVFMSGERMALLLTGLGFVIAFFLLPISKRLMLLIGITGALGIGLLAYTNPGLVQRHLGSTTKVVEDLGASDYGKIWMSAIEMTKQHPLFGVGLRQFREVCPDAAYGPTDTIAQRCNQHTHNTYLEWLAESGLVGLTLFILLLSLYAQQMIWGVRRLRYSDPVFLGLVITVCIRLWPLASTTSFFTAWSAVPMWLVIGWMLAIIQNEKEKQA